MAAVAALARACGAEPVLANPAEHDAWVGLVSHAPHVVSAAMAARLTEAGTARWPWPARACAT